MTKRRDEERPVPGGAGDDARRDPSRAARDSAGGLGPEGIEPGGDLGPETSVAPDSPEGLVQEVERLRARENELLRAVAEQQNITRRRKQDMENAIELAQESLVRGLLPVLDDFERAFGAMEGKVDPSIRDGMALIGERLLRTLTAQGLEPIRPSGEHFDPTVHEAVAQRPARGQREGTVLQLVEPGYRFRGRLLRPAKVIVASADDHGAGAHATRHAAG